uniref:Uncharacterized protein TCIL3000_6_1430 n=1 Tax=Trypanosoma congolense (strain IL3000) TaxID=1068625 RepID=G0UNF1_TRYCI|nr:unnamed protein product [Trypanosoma congolense IL3000]
MWKEREGLRCCRGLFRLYYYYYSVHLPIFFFFPAMSRFKQCLAVINTRSGAREGLSVFASALQRYLDNAGIVHHDFCVPERDIAHVMAHHAGNVDAVVVCGGDGTLSSVVNVLAATPGHPLISTPIVSVPCGLQNSIAASLGIYSAERSVSAFVIGSLQQVPLWEVRINGAVARYIVSYIAVGTYAMCVKRLHDLDAVGDDFVALPMVKGKYRMGALYTALRNEVVPCSAKVTYGGEGGNGKAGKHGRAPLLIASPMKMLLAAQMPLQHRHYTLTPRATFKCGSLCVTYATEAATRLRIWHLLSREAAQGVVMHEDGVGEVVGVSEVELEVHDASWSGCGQSDVIMMLDGEAVRLPPGTKVLVQRVPCRVLFASC